MQPSNYESSHVSFYRFYDVRAELANVKLNGLQFDGGIDGNFLETVQFHWSTLDVNFFLLSEKTFTSSTSWRQCVFI